MWSTEVSTPFHPVPRMNSPVSFDVTWLTGVSMIGTDPVGTFQDRIVTEGCSLTDAVKMAQCVLAFESYDSTGEGIPLSATRRSAMVAARTSITVFERTGTDRLDETDCQGDLVVLGEVDRTLAPTLTLLPTSCFWSHMRATVKHACADPSDPGQRGRNTSMPYCAVLCRPEQVLVDSRLNQVERLRAPHHGTSAAVLDPEKGSEFGLFRGISPPPKALPRPHDVRS